MAGAGAAKGAGEGRKSDHRRVRGEVSQAIGVRSHRELITLGTAIDLLIMGELPELGDLLMQRLKALETSLVGSNWISARHQELIPPRAASLSSESEKRRAAKQEAASLKRSKSPEQVRRVHFDDRPREIGRQGGAKEKPGGLSSAKQRRSAWQKEIWPRKEGADRDVGYATTELSGHGPNTVAIVECLVRHRELIESCGMVYT